MNKLCSIDQALGLFEYCDIVNITASGGGSLGADLIYMKQVTVLRQP